MSAQRSGGACRLSEPTARAGRVLIIDDEVAFVDSLRMGLCDEFEVAGTPRALEALGWLLSGDWYDVVLCDVSMGVMNGIELRSR